MWRRLQQLFNKIIDWVRGLFQKPEPPPPTPEIQSLSDAGYERLFLQLLDRIAAGESQQQILELLGDRREDKFFKSWLRRFGKKLVESPIPNREIATRMVQLGAIDCGEICQLAGEYGNQQLARDYSPLTEPEYEILFQQLLQQVGQSEAAVTDFLAEIETRANLEQWVQWLRGYGDRLLAPEKPNYQLATSLILLKEQTQQHPTFREFGEIAGDISQQLRQREEDEEIWEYDGADLYSVKASE